LEKTTKIAIKIQDVANFTYGAQILMETIYLLHNLDDEANENAAHKRLVLFLVTKKSAFKFINCGVN
jgi:hypothetical protein